MMKIKKIGTFNVAFLDNVQTKDANKALFFPLHAHGA